MTEKLLFYRIPSHLIPVINTVFNPNAIVYVQCPGTVLSMDTIGLSKFENQIQSPEGAQVFCPECRQIVRVKARSV